MHAKRIDIYPFGGRSVAVKPTGERLSTNPRLSGYIERQWNLKKDKWVSSWIPLLSRIEFTDSDVFLEAGAMTYGQTWGCLEAIKSRQDFAPRHGYVNNLSIGLYLLTSDGYVPIARRDAGLHCPRMWNFHGGYMTSMLLVDRREEAEKEHFARKDSKIFDLQDQAMRRVQRQEILGLKQEDMQLAENPIALAIGYSHSLEPEVAWTASLKKDRKEVAERLTEYEYAKGRKEHTRVDFVHKEELGKLLKNQGDLINSNPLTYNTDDPTKLLLVDVNIGELIGGAYRQLANEELDEEIPEYLMGKGFEIRVFKTDQGFFQKFPASH